MMRPAHGFTLVELLAAIAIFAVMALMAYGGLAAVLNARASVEASLARTAEIQKALYRLQSDLEQARPRPIRDEYGDEQPALLTHEQGREGLRLEFTRGGWRNPRLQRRSALERVAYGLEDGRLVRYSWTTLDRAGDEALVEVPLLEGVESLAWRFLDSQRSWRDRWPPQAAVGGTATEPLPLAVELSLTTRDWGEIRYLFRLIPRQLSAPGTPP
jgi:general secretion pathway protein J